MPARPAKWLQVTVAVDDEAQETVAEIVRRCTGRGIAIEQDDRTLYVRGYVPLGRPGRHRIAEIERALAHLSLLRSLPIVSIQEIEEEDWANAWKEHFAAHRIGRIAIKPSWQDYKPRRGEAVVELDPGMAFGTGLHPTTRRCLLELQRRLASGMRVLDLGTGSGILALAAAKLGAARVTALDTDETAVSAAQANVRANGLEALVEVLPGSLPHPRAPQGSFDLVLANITAPVIQRLARELVSALFPSGVLVVAGIVSEGATETKRCLQEAGARVLLERRDGDWRALVVTRADS